MHSDIGRSCIAANVDRKPCPLSQALQSGQTIEIITSPNSQPSVGWLNFVVTAKARTNIRHALKNLRTDTAIQLGKRQLMTALLPKKIEDIEPHRINNLLIELKLENFDDLLAEIGLGNQMSVVIAYRLLGETIEIDIDGDSTNSKSALQIKGSEGLLTTFAQCCRPIPGDPIVAYASPGKGLVVHHERCANLKNRQEHHEHYVSVTWEESSSKIGFEAELRIEMINQQGALPNLTSVISSLDSNIHSIWTEEQDGRLYQIVVLLTTKDTQHLANIIRKIKTIPGFVSIERNTNS